MNPKRASKRGICSTTIKILRLKAIGKSEECSAIILGLSPRQVRRKLEYLKDKLGVFCTVALMHLIHSFDLMYTCAQEREDWLKEHNPIKWREAA